MNNCIFVEFSQKFGLMLFVQIFSSSFLYAFDALKEAWGIQNVLLFLIGFHIFSLGILIYLHKTEPMAHAMVPKLKTKEINYKTDFRVDVEIISIEG